MRQRIRHRVVARVEVRQVWFVEGVVPMAAGGMGPRAFAASCSVTLVSFSRGQPHLEFRQQGGPFALRCKTILSWGLVIDNLLKE